MTTYYVNAIDGSSSNSGTSAGDALATLQAAEDLVHPGDTVEVMSGTYTASYWGDALDITTSGTPTAPITFEAAPGQTPIINSSAGWNGIDIQASYIIINGFTVEGDAASYTLAQAQAQKDNIEDPYFDGNGIMVSSPGGGVVPNHVTIENNTVFDEPGGGIGTNGADYIQILGNVVHNNANWSPYDNSGISIYASKNFDTNPGVHDIISGNTSYGNADLIPDFFSGSVTDGEGIILDTNADYVGVMEVENNAAYGNGGPGIEDYLTNNAVINGNTVYGNLTTSALASEGQIFINEATGVTVTNNTTTEPDGGSTISLPSTNRDPVIDQSNVTVVGTANFSLFIGGTHDTAILSGSHETVQAYEGYNTIITSRGDDTIDISGSGNAVDAAGGVTNISDTGTNNTIVLPDVAQGVDWINGDALLNGDTIDLRPLLASTSWSGSQDTLANFLRVETSGTNALLEARAAPTGNFRSNAVFEGSVGLTLSHLLTQAIT